MATKNLFPYCCLNIYFWINYLHKTRFKNRASFTFITNMLKESFKYLNSAFEFQVSFTKKIADFSLNIHSDSMSEESVGSVLANF